MRTPLCSRSNESCVTHATEKNQESMEWLHGLSPLYYEDERSLRGMKASDQSAGAQQFDVPGTIPPGSGAVAKSGTWLDDLLASDQLHVAFQPIINLHTAEIIGRGSPLLGARGDIEPFRDLDLGGVKKREHRSRVDCG
jgi:hypothetical protein